MSRQFPDNSSWDKPQTFINDLTSVINRYSKENGSDTPDFLLASYLESCLDNYNEIIQAREKWYGRRCGYGAAILASPNPDSPRSTNDPCQA